MKKIAIAALLSVVVAPAVAADEPHMYAGLRAGPANTNIDNVINGNTSGNPTGWGIFVGHIVNPNFSVEAEYLNLGEIKSNTNSQKSELSDISWRFFLSVSRQMFRYQHLFSVLWKPSTPMHEFLETAVHSAFNMIRGSRHMRVANEGKKMRQRIAQE